MQFVHVREFLAGGDTVVVDCPNPCNIWLLDDANFERFRNGDRFHFHGGFFPSTARIAVPTTGCWNVTLNRENDGSISRYTISYLRREQGGVTIAAQRSETAAYLIPSR